LRGTAAVGLRSPGRRHSLHGRQFRRIIRVGTGMVTRDSQAAMTLPPKDWPNRRWSRAVETEGVHWHVQVLGEGPVLLLVHGTGASTHSWRAMMPLLARRFCVVAPDLPGHGFTAVPSWHSLALPAMARDLRDLVGALGMRPVLCVGHSAGAAILARMCLDGMLAPAGLVSLNGAFMPYGGAAGQVFAGLARVLVGLPLVTSLLAWRASDRSVVQRLLEGTGSRLDPAGIDLYARLMREPEHAAAAMRMMASWDLVPVLRDLPHLPVKLLLVAGENDRTIPPADSLRLAALVPGAERVVQQGLGHLSHEEDPAATVALIEAFARRLGVSAAA
jgi:magnesium chelatase accessory protein